MPLRTRPIFAWATLALSLMSAAGLAPRADAKLTFNLTSDTLSQDSQVYKGFQAAAARWSNLFANSMTVNLEIEYQPIYDSDGNPNDILGGTGSTQALYSYSSVRQALIAHSATSAADANIAAVLSTGSTYNKLINYTAENNSAVPGLVADSQIFMTTENAKALGLRSGTDRQLDAYIEFNSNDNPYFEFDPSKVQGSNKLDFVGVATHEIGHSLGFVSNVDDIDTNPGYYPGQATTARPNAAASTLDLFRFSAASAGQNAIDMTASTTAKYFSLNGGRTQGPGFSTGQNFGDGDQASHWMSAENNNNQVVGIMDPYGRQGQVLSISQNDITAFDAIGYNVRVAAVPEPSLVAAFGMGLVALGGVWKRQRRQAVRRGLKSVKKL